MAIPFQSGRSFGHRYRQSDQGDITCDNPLPIGAIIRRAFCCTTISGGFLLHSELSTSHIYGYRQYLVSTSPNPVTFPFCCTPGQPGANRLVNVQARTKRSWQVDGTAMLSPFWLQPQARQSLLHCITDARAAQNASGSAARSLIYSELVVQRKPVSLISDCSMGFIFLLQPRLFPTNPLSPILLPSGANRPGQAACPGP